MVSVSFRKLRHWWFHFRSFPLLKTVNKIIVREITFKDHWNSYWQRCGAGRLWWLRLQEPVQRSLDRRRRLQEPELEPTTWAGVGAGSGAIGLAEHFKELVYFSLLPVLLQICTCMPLVQNILWLDIQFLAELQSTKTSSLELQSGLWSRLYPQQTP